MHIASESDVAKSSRQIKRIMERAGWELQRQTGLHMQFRRPGNPFVVTLPHPKKDLPIGVVRDIERKTGLTF